jgi:hypothetical protein
MNMLNFGRQSGFALVALMAIATILMLSGIAFMRWSTDESQQSQELSGAMQAYYLAQMGIVEQGFTYLRTTPAGQLPIGETVLPGRAVPGVGRYENVSVSLFTGQSGGNFWIQNRKYRIASVGTVRIPVIHNGRSDFKNIKRKAVLYVEVRSFVDYMYLTNCERTPFGERIRFWHEDTLQGRVHSNDQIAIMENPVFYEQVSSTANNFEQGTGYSPIFLGPPPVFRAPLIPIPNMADNLRAGAAQQGLVYDYPGYTLRAVFSGSTIQFTRWLTGTPYDSTIYWPVTIGDHTCIFVEGPLEIKGMVHGRVTIGSSELIRIIDNIYYECAGPVSHNWRPPVNPDHCQDYLGIVSEGEVKIADTPENGRDNSGINPPASGNTQTNPARTDVIINGAIVALGESFTFENQNDPDSGFVSSTIPDDRGSIFLWGSVTQMRRGYVHRRLNVSTGYAKRYTYDRRLLLNRPPCFFDVKDEQGHALFNVVQWGQGMEYAPDVRNWNVVRYN